ncbi:phasin family protein [Pseudomonadales bacterium]|nr:phasin family protein [Pseudomonadales bacterium]
MNVIEKQTELTNSLFNINSGALKEFTSQQKANVEKYIETNKSFGERLPEVRDISGFLTLQREYGESLWANAKSALETQNELVKTTFEETRDAFKLAMTTDEVSEESAEDKAEAVPAKKAKTKAKPKAKKTAE